MYPDLLGRRSDMERLSDRRVRENKARLVLRRSVWNSLTIGKLTNDAGGKLENSVSWGIDVHVSTQCPPGGFGVMARPLGP